MNFIVWAFPIHKLHWLWKFASVHVTWTQLSQTSHCTCVSTHFTCISTHFTCICHFSYIINVSNVNQWMHDLYCYSLIAYKNLLVEQLLYQNNFIINMQDDLKDYFSQRYRNLRRYSERTDTGKSDTKIVPKEKAIPMVKTHECLDKIRRLFKIHGKPTQRS